MFRAITIAAVLTLLTVSSAWAQSPPLVRNGGFEGQPTDHSDGRGEIMLPPDWSPVNIDTARGDRIAPEASDRPDAGQALHIKTFGYDAGTYQSIQGLEPGRCYVLSAWVKRASGRLTLEAYSYAWGPPVMVWRDGSSEGWQHVTVPLTPVDGGVHLYVCAAGEADFLVDDIKLVRTPWQLSAPRIDSADLAGTWLAKVKVARDAGTETVEPKLVLATNEFGAAAVVPEQTHMGNADSAELEFRLPFTRFPQAVVAELRDPVSDATLAAAPLTTLGGQPWAFRFPHKNALFSSMGYHDEVQVKLRVLSPEVMAQLTATAEVLDDQTVIKRVKGNLREDIIACRLSGADLPRKELRLRLTLTDGAGRVVQTQERPLRVQPPAAAEVVCDSEGMTRINGQRFFPIGMYWVFADPVKWLPGPGRADAEFRELRDAGFNTLHTYAFEHNNDQDTDENALAYLDMAQEFGFKVMMGLRRDWVEGGNFEAISRRVERLKAHPALLCWTIWDEPNLARDVPWWVKRCTEVYQLVDRLDPYHPAMEVFGSVSAIDQFGGCTDVNLYDYYPGRGNAGYLPPLMAIARDQIPDKPMWYVGQAYNDPSEQDMRDATRYARDAGAKSIFYYSYGGGGFDWDSCRKTPELWASLKRVVGELAASVP